MKYKYQINSKMNLKDQAGWSNRYKYKKFKNLIKAILKDKSSNNRNVVFDYRIIPYEKS